MAGLASKGVHMSVIQCSLCDKAYKGLTDKVVAQVKVHFRLRHKGKRHEDNIVMTSLVGNKHDLGNMVRGSEIRDGAVSFKDTGLVSTHAIKRRKDAEGDLTTISAPISDGKREIKMGKPEKQALT